MTAPDTRLDARQRTQLVRLAGYPHENSAPVLMSIGLMDAKEHMSIVVAVAVVEELERAARDAEAAYSEARAELCKLLGVPVGPNVGPRRVG